MAGVVARRGLPRGRESRAFSSRELVDAALAHGDQCVYLELDSEGNVVCASGAPRAAAAVCARLAPHGPARSAELGACAGGWRLRLLADFAPHQELLLWFDERALAAAHMPFLTLHNIRGKKDYVCHECGVKFEHPNPLKVHLFLSCRPYTPARFWRTFAARVAKPPLAAGSRTSAFSAYRAAAAAGPASPAALEALATEWGRACGAHAGHVCVYCGKLYSRKYGLKIHIRTHTGYKPLRCRHCARAFGDPSNLNKHLRLHAAPAPPDRAASPARAAHACPICGKPLARRRDLERHLRARHDATLAQTDTERS